MVAKKKTKKAGRTTKVAGKKKGKAQAKAGKAKVVKKKASVKKVSSGKAVKKPRASRKETGALGISLQEVVNIAKNVGKARTKSDIYSILAQASGLTKREIVMVFAKLQELIHLDLSKEGPGVFALPGLMKIVKVFKPATKARQGINPLTKEPIVFKAKPARNIVKVRALKALKEMVQ